MKTDESQAMMLQHSSQDNDQWFLPSNASKTCVTACEKCFALRWIVSIKAATPSADDTSFWNEVP